MRALSCGEVHLDLELDVRRVDGGRCGPVKRERLTWLADHPFDTKRFAFLVGRRGRAATLKEVAKEVHWHGDSVKELEQQYLREQWRRVGTPGPKVIGLEEIAIRKGHPCRMVVSDLLRRRPLWFGGTDRSQASLALCFHALGMKTCRGLYGAVMDRWKPFRNAPVKQVPAARILFDKFQVIGPLGAALDQVRTSGEARLTGQDRPFIQGQKDTLLSHHAQLTLEGRRSRAKRLQANQRLNLAERLKESFGPLGNYQRAAWARRLFEHWKQALKWQRVKP